MFQHKLRLSLGLGLLIMVGLTGLWAHHHQALRQLNFPQSRTATVLLPGDGGNWLSLRSLTLTLDHPRVATHVLTARVSRSTHVTWQRYRTISNNNPIIPVLFQDNTHPQRQARQLITVLTQLAHRYGITHVNLVGHSSGGTIAFDYLNGAQLAPVTVTHLVCIGADFPQQSPLERHYSQLHVLNLAGQIDAVPNNGEVPLTDAQKLSSLVRGHVASYQFRRISGHLWQVEHSLLHESASVDRQIATFLYRPN